MSFVALTREMDDDEDSKIREKVEKYTRMLSCDNKVGDNYFLRAFCKSFMR